MRLAELAKVNAAPFEEELIYITGNKNEHPFIQTMAFGLLREIGTAKSIIVRKFHFEKKIIPAITDEAFNRPYFLAVMEHLEQMAGQHNPVLYEQAAELVKHYQFLMHPFDPDILPGKWADASLLKMKQMYEQGEAEEIDPEIAKAWAFMQELDEISAF
jgi:hypothetical protein